MKFFFILTFTCIFPFPLFSQQYSLRFFGNGISAPDQDRVKISIDQPNRPIDVAKNFTIEFWMKATGDGSNGNVSAASNGDGWITGNIIIDRDVYGSGDLGDFGIAMGKYSGGGSKRVIAFGIDVQGTGITIRGNTNVADDQWHHVAVTRNANTGKIKLFLDGSLEASGNGPLGNASYRNNRVTSYPNSDPFMVLGAEKHDAGAAYPSYNGYMDELRISKSIRYNAAFLPPIEEFTTDAKTAGLYHFNEGNGTVLNDVSLATGGPSNGQINYGGSPLGPEWSTQNPFGLKLTEENFAGDQRIAENEFYMFPNPTQGLLQIVLREKNLQLFIEDVSGRLVFEKYYDEAGVFPIDFFSSSNGIYIVSVRRSNQTFIQKLLVKE